MKRFKNIISIITIALFVGYYVSSTMFVHTHEFEWGKVTHSHPCIPQSGHSHSATACSACDSIGNALFIASYSTIVVVLFATAYRYANQEVRKTESQCELVYGLRAPPVC